MQRREAAEAADIAPFSYRSQNAVFFIHGPYYVEIIAAGGAESPVRYLKTLALEYIRRTRVDAKVLPELALFPKAHLEAKSFMLIPADAFGYERLDHIFTAVYVLDGSRLTAFISRRKSPVEAQDLAAAYCDFLIAFGGRTEPVEYKNTQVVRIFDACEYIFHLGPYLAGVHEAADCSQAATLAKMLENKLAEEFGERARIICRHGAVAILWCGRQRRGPPLPRRPPLASCSMTPRDLERSRLCTGTFVCRIFLWPPKAVGCALSEGPIGLSALSWL